MKTSKAPRVTISVIKNIVKCYVFRVLVLVLSYIQRGVVYVVPLANLDLATPVSTGNFPAAYYSRETAPRTFRRAQEPSGSSVLRIEYSENDVINFSV